MKLQDIYTLLDRHEITEEEAAEALDMSLKTLRFHIRRHGHRLPLILIVMDKLAENQITRDEAATLLGVSVRQINMYERTWKITKPLKPYLFSRERAQVKWELRKRFAIEYIAGTMSLDDAADKAEVSDRQMRRWISELLDRHYGMVWGDLNVIDEAKRRRIADEIQQKEQLEYEKTRTLDNIASGRKDIGDYVLDRMLRKRQKR